MPTTQSPLIVTIDWISLSFGGAPAQEYRLQPSIQSYSGLRLFCKVINDSRGLTIKIDEATGPDMLHPKGSAASAVVAIAYGKQTATTSTSPVAISYTGQPLVFQMKIRSDLQSGILVVKEDLTGAVSPPAGNNKFGYVLLQDLTTPDDPKNDYTLHWVVVDDQLQEIAIGDPSKRTVGRVLPPAPDNGGLGGPMGLTVP